MKNNMASGICLAILGAFISITPNFIVGRFYLEDMGVDCLWTAKMEFGMGILIIILASSFIFYESGETKLGISLSLTLIGIFSALIATVFIGFCDGCCYAECFCSPTALLLVVLLGILVALISFVNFISLSKKR